MISIMGRVLSESDRGSKVTYVPAHVEGNAGHKDCEHGTISSWERIKRPVLMI